MERLYQIFSMCICMLIIRGAISLSGDHIGSPLGRPHWVAPTLDTPRRPRYFGRGARTHAALPQYARATAKNRALYHKLRRITTNCRWPNAAEYQAHLQDTDGCASEPYAEGIGEHASRIELKRDRPRPTYPPPICHPVRSYLKQNWLRPILFFGHPV